MRFEVNLHYSDTNPNNSNPLVERFIPRSVATSVEISECTAKQAPVAFLVQSPMMFHLRSGDEFLPNGFRYDFDRKRGSFLWIEYRYYNKTLYVRDYARNYVKNGTGVVTVKSLSRLFREFTKSRKKNFERARKDLLSVAGCYLLIDGEVWVSTTEPAYRLGTRAEDESPLDLHTAIIAESHDPARAVDYFNALQWDDMLTLAKARAKIREESLKEIDIQGFSRIKVLIPEAVTLPKRKIQLYNSGKMSDRITSAFSCIPDENPSKGRYNYGSDPVPPGARRYSRKYRRVTV